MKQRTSGVALLVVVLFTAAILVTILITTTTIALNTRQTSSSDTASYQALLAAESGANAFTPLVTSAATRFTGTVPTSCATSSTAALKAACALNAWLSASTITPYSAANGTVNFTAKNITLDSSGNISSVDVEAGSVVGGDQARVIGTYKLSKLALAPPNVYGALTSWPSVTLSGGAVISGTTASGSSETYTNFLNVTSSNTINLTTSITPTTATVSVASDATSQSNSSLLKAGMYVRLPVKSNTSATTATGTFKVTSNNNGEVNLTAVSLPALPSGTSSWQLPSGTSGLNYIYNAVTSYTSASNTLTLTSAEGFYKDDTIALNIGGVTYTATVATATNNSTDPKTSTVTVTGWVPTNPGVLVTEGQAVTKSTNGIATSGVYNQNGGANVVGGVVQGSGTVPSPLSDALFQQTFGVNSATLSSYTTKVPEASFTGAVSGLTWVSSTDGNVNLNNEKINGNGILVIDGDLNINQNGQAGDVCDFKGLIYVRGNLDLKGNLQVCGAVVVEGSVLSSGTVIGTDNSSTDIAGNGRKVAYDINALISAFNGIGGYTFAPLNYTWRQR
ncbi:hypothetical protein [Deinococcus pimensis]|uniref:hypothetical protein n=1 Tax=Deinococcus pimensis TaxID=309888 RepID=UPI00048990EB|nr:hypothetical protein [Deinococcus pimensis]